MPMKALRARLECLGKLRWLLPPTRTWQPLSV